MEDSSRKPLTLSECNYCPMAKAIVTSQGNENITDGKGNCTDLYWHIEGCDECNI